MRTTPLQGLPWPAQCPLSHQPCLLRQDVTTQKSPKKQLARSKYRRVLTDEQRALRKQRQQELLGQQKQLRHSTADALTLEQQRVQLNQTRSKLFIIDGYNIINKDDQLRTAMDMEPSIARAKLERLVMPLATPPKSDVIIVYDAMSQAGKRSDHKISQPCSGLTVVYATTAEADTYIIEHAEELNRSGAGKNVFVITYDNRIKDAVWEQDCTPAGLELLQGELEAIQQAARHQVVMPSKAPAPSLHQNTSEWARRMLTSSDAASQAGQASSSPTGAAAAARKSKRRQKPAVPRAAGRTADVPDVDPGSIDLNKLLSKDTMNLDDVDKLLDSLI
jgi:predicted RNA-binding protein with PIN domain